MSNYESRTHALSVTLIDVYMLNVSIEKVISTLQK